MRTAEENLENMQSQLVLLNTASVSQPILQAIVKMMLEREINSEIAMREVLNANHRTTGGTK